ncbi:MAG: C10 family peptidase [Paludibacter sp.]
MKKIILLAIVNILCISNGYSKSRTESEAQKMLATFLNQPSGMMKKAPAAVNKVKLVYASVDKTTSSTLANNAYYYVYNVGENDGFVIVSGDDRAKDILGYSDSGTFESNEIPENLKSWLDFYASELKLLAAQPETAAFAPRLRTNAATKVVKNERTFATTVAPLLGGIKWNQGSPYNNMCPMFDATTRCVSGCVATGMAQVMKYHAWPMMGRGSKTYTTKTLNVPLSVDFSITEYKWLNMSDTYSTSSTQIQKDAVATLMYSCGVAVNMDYGKSSSASSVTMAKSLITYFNYDANTQFYQRDYYTKAEWANIIKTELNASRPVLYDGQSATGGHLFVCDGYDSNGLFHFNWGWGGSSNGYFELTVLNPSDQGIGGTAGGYNAGQGITVGVQKPNPNSTPTYRLCASKISTNEVDSIDRNAIFTVYSTSLYNNGINAFDGNVALALYNDSSLIQIIKNSAISKLSGMTGYSLYSYSTTIPAEIPNGNYKLYVIYKANSESQWQKIRQKVGTQDYLNITVTSNKLKLYATRDLYPQLVLNNYEASNNFYQTKTGKINVNITNNGGEYNSTFTVILQNDSVATNTQIITTQPINITSGETKSLDLNGIVTATPGMYHLKVMYDSLNIRSNGTTNCSLIEIPVQVLAAPTGVTNLVLTSAISFPDPKKVDKNNAVLTAHIKNTDGYFDSRLVANIYPRNGGSIIATLGNQSVVIEKGVEKTITFSGVINLNPSTYAIELDYYTASKTWAQVQPSDSAALVFTLVDNYSALSESKFSADLMLYPNPTHNILSLKSEEIVKSIRIIDILGKEVLYAKPEKNGEIFVVVENLKSGTYMLKSETEKGIKVAKFIKN